MKNNLIKTHFTFFLAYTLPLGAYAGVWEDRLAKHEFEAALKAALPKPPKCLSELCRGIIPNDGLRHSALSFIKKHMHGALSDTELLEALSFFEEETTIRGHKHLQHFLQEICVEGVPAHKQLTVLNFLKEYRAKEKRRKFTAEICHLHAALGLASGHKDEKALILYFYSQLPSDEARIEAITNLKALKSHDDKEAVKKELRRQNPMEKQISLLMGLVKSFGLPVKEGVKNPIQVHITRAKNFGRPVNKAKRVIDTNS